RETTLLKHERSSKHVSVDESISRELSRIKNEQLCEEKLREQIRRESHELRALESKLREAYTARELLAQMAEKRALAYDQMAEEALYAHHVNLEQGSEKLQREQEDQARKAAKERLRAQLELQLNEQEQARQIAFGEFLKDKQMVNEVVQRIQREDKIERDKHEKLKEIIKADIAEQQSLRITYKKLEQAELNKEEEAIKAYVAQKDMEKRTVEEDKKARQQAVEHLQEKLGKELIQKQALGRELEEIHQTLLLEEEAAKTRNAEQEAVMRKMNDQQRLRDEYAKQFEYRRQQEKKEREEENKLREIMRMQFQHDERLVLAEAVKQQSKKQEYASLARQELIEKRERLQAEFRHAQMDLEKQTEQARQRRAIEEEERRRLLHKHAVELIDHLPKGVFRSKEELEQIVRIANSTDKRDC
ncbi:hypothetical protein EG68_08418, partial [Paragonimus skrjabini miyazakii]